jgi:hypothetical protein
MPRLRKGRPSFMLSRVKQFLRRLMVLTAQSHEALQRQQLLLGKAAALQLRQVDRVERLSDVGFSVFSQTDEDGIIEWLVQRLGIEHRTFIEIGVAAEESNTRFLLAHRNWRGVIFDGDASIIETVRSGPDYWRRNLTAQTAFITRESADDLFVKSGIAGDIGLLSIDINGNDYWVTEAINAVRPIIMICEYNATFGDLVPVAVPYDPAFDREKAHSTHCYWGASIAAFNHLAAKKGYTLVGTNEAGFNAFYVRNDYMPRLAGRIGDTRPTVNFYRQGVAPDGAKLMLLGQARLEPIRHLPVVNVVTGETKPLSAFEPLVSDDWKRQSA